DRRRLSTTRPGDEQHCGIWDEHDDQEAAAGTATGTTHASTERGALKRACGLLMQSEASPHTSSCSQDSLSCSPSRLAVLGVRDSSLLPPHAAIRPVPSSLSSLRPCGPVWGGMSRG